MSCGTADPTPTPIATSTPFLAPLATPTPTAAPERILPTPTPSAPREPVPVYGGVLRFALDRGFDNFDPAYQFDIAFRRVNHAIYGTLVVLNPDGTIEPSLARSWDISSDGRSITFKLEEDIEFHDGSKLDAQAVKWNFDRFLDPEVGSPRSRDLVPPLESVDVVDEATVRFNLSQAFRPLLIPLTVRAGHLASPTAVQELNSYSERIGDFGRHPVGAGAFRFKEWVPGSHVEVVRNDNYWDEGKPYLDAIRFPIVPDRQVIFAMLRTSNLDILDTMLPSDVGIAEQNPNIDVLSIDGFVVDNWYFRNTVEPWNNKALRQAVSYAIDREAMVDVIYDGLAEPAYYPLGKAYGTWYDSTIQMYKYSPEKAREKVKEAGYPEGFSYTQPCRSTGFQMLRCEVVQSMLGDVGINMTIQPYEHAAYFGDWRTGKFNEPLVLSIFSRIDPHRNLHRLFHSGGSFNGPAGPDYNNPEYDRLIDEASTIYDISKAKALYTKAALVMLEDAATLFTTQRPFLYGVLNTVKNFVTRPHGEPIFTEVWISR